MKKKNLYRIAAILLTGMLSVPMAASAALDFIGPGSSGRVGNDVEAGDAVTEKRSSDANRTGIAEPVPNNRTVKIMPDSYAGSRFTDNSDGTVTDNLTGLIWLKKANCGGTKLWQSAVDFAAALYDGWKGDGSGGDCALEDNSTVGQWRLPTIKELQTLVDYRYTDPALSDTAGTAKWAEGDVFTGVQPSVFWSSSTFADFPGDAWLVHLRYGYVGLGAKAYGSNFVWPVRGGR